MSSPKEGDIFNNLNGATHDEHIFTNRSSNTLHSTSKLTCLAFVDSLLQQSRHSPRRPSYSSLGIHSDGDAVRVVMRMMKDDRWSSLRSVVDWPEDECFRLLPLRISILLLPSVTASSSAFLFASVCAGSCERMVFLFSFCSLFWRFWFFKNMVGSYRWFESISNEGLWVPSKGDWMVVFDYYQGRMWEGGDEGCWRVMEAWNYGSCWRILEYVIKWLKKLAGSGDCYQLREKDPPVSSVMKGFLNDEVLLFSFFNPVIFPFIICYGCCILFGFVRSCYRFWFN